MSPVFAALITAPNKVEITFKIACGGAWAIYDPLTFNM